MGTSPLSSVLALRLGLRYDAQGTFPFTRSKELKEKLQIEDKAVVAAGCARLIKVRGSRRGLSAPSLACPRLRSLI